ncbi:MAG: hypothetical protein QOF70_3921, partial [Acetobacteraceae bacterium]|nr:hypothetical protein [Acetobacteraceae bacterium]
LDGWFRLAAVAERVAEQLVGLGALGAGAEYEVGGLDGIPRTVQGEEDVGAGELEFGGGLQGDRLAEQRVCDGRAAGLQGERTQGVQCVGVPRHRGDHLAVDPFGFLHPAGHVELLGLAEEGVDLLRPFAHAVGVAPGGGNAQ